MMRSQVSRTGQSSGGSSIDQKKSVFDRLGGQLDAGRGSMKRRPSPGQYPGDYMPPPMHEADFGRYGRDGPHAQAELEWRYHNERSRHMPPFPPRDRHPPPQLPLPPPPPMPGHYEMDMGNRPSPYYPNPHQHPHHNAQPGPPPPPMGPGAMSMSMHQQRSSPKYDRHGNVIQNFKVRMGPMDNHPSMSPSRSFMPPGPMMHPGPPHEMPPIRPPGGMYPPHRWHDNLEPDFQPHSGRMIQEGRFSPVGSRRYQQQQQSQQHLMLNTQGPPGHPGGCEVPRYTKWRERRDVITTLDRETAQSSSRTDSLKSTLQQPDNRVSAKIEANLSDVGSTKMGKPSSSAQHTVVTKKPPLEAAKKVSATSELSSLPNEKDSAASKESSKPKVPHVKTEPQDISDGEIVDDEDSSDDSEVVVSNVKKDGDLIDANYRNRSKNLSDPYGRNRESHQYYESNRKRRLLECDDYSMDYETISDEDLDVFMGDKKISDINVEDAKLGDRLEGEEGGKSLSQIELLNALGLDWANLVEMAKQSKTSGKEAGHTSGSGLLRFSLPNYLPTLGITPDLTGPELYDLITKVCRS